MSGNPMQSTVTQPARLQLAKELVVALEAGDDEMADQHLRSLGAESQLYNRVGRVAREVHERLLEFLSGSGLADMAQGETSDACRRLEHVIELTDDAAHRTLSAVERTRPHIDAILGNNSNGPGIEETANALAAREHVEAIKTELSQIVMAQEFQDLSGQIIRRAIALVTDIEARLIELLDLAGVQAGEGASASSPGTEHGEGPRVSGTANEDSLANQDDVDDLLKSLGF